MPPALVPTAVPPTQQQQHEPHYKNWVKTTKKKDTGSIYFIVKEDDNDEIAAFKALKEINRRQFKVQDSRAQIADVVHL